MSFLNKMRRQKLLSFSLILFTSMIGVLIGTLASTGVKAAKEQAVAPGATPLTIPNPVQLSNAFSQVAKQLEPSVVNISSTYVQKTSPRGGCQERGRRSSNNSPMMRTMTMATGCRTCSNASSVTRLMRRHRSVLAKATVWGPEWWLTRAATF